MSWGGFLLVATTLSRRSADLLLVISPPDLPTLEGFARGDTCNKKDLEKFLHEVMSKPTAKDGTLDFNHYQQAKEYVRLSWCNLWH